MESLVVPGTMDSLSRIGEHILQAAAVAGLEKKRAYRLRLAVDEIATNVVEHGYDGGNENERLVVHVELTPDALIITLEDTSPAFDPRGVEVNEEANLARPLEERPIGQLGILLALQGIDHFDYQSTSGCNRSIFLIRREDAPHSAFIENTHHEEG